MVLWGWVQDLFTESIFWVGYPRSAFCEESNLRLSSMLLRSLYILQNLSRSSSNINPKHAVLAAFQPLLHNRPYANTPQPAASAASVNRTELAKFAAIADSWWDVEGPFKPLHVMNPSRLAFLRSILCSVAWSSWVIYFAATFQILAVFAGPSLRSIVSKQVGPTEQGKAQGCITGLWSFASIVSPLIFSPLTALFLSDDAPFVFPGFSLVCAAFAVMIAFIQSVMIRAPQIMSLNNSLSE